MWRLILIAFLAALSLWQASAAADEASHGLTVQDGIPMLAGKPYRGIGVNYFSLASRLLKDPKDTSSLTNLAELKKMDVPFVRFMCGGFWPAEQRFYLTNREEFLKRLDQVVRCAESNRVGLVPSLFWNLATLTDLADEPAQELGNTNSRSIALIREYTRTIVARYRRSPAIWGWEFGNEGSLSADLPNASEHRPPVVPDLGTRASRTAADELRSAPLEVALKEFSNTIRQLDGSRLIISGNALPRASAWHNTHFTNWVPDTPAQFRSVLLRDNPDPINCISVHLYPEPSYPAGANSLQQIVDLVAREATDARKPLFVGEFGVSRKAGSIEDQKKTFAQFIAAFEHSHVPLAAAWVFDYSDQNDDWNITFANDRGEFLRMIGAANRRWKN